MSIASVMMVIRRAGEVLPSSTTSIPPESAFGLDVSEEERQMLLLALAHASLERPGWLDALRRLARKFDVLDEKQLDAANQYAPLFEKFRQTGNSAIVRARVALEEALEATPRCSECDLPSDFTRFDAASDPVPSCAIHARVARVGGMDGDEPPVERKWVGRIVTAKEALKHVHLG